MEYTYKVSGVKVYDAEGKKDIIKEATFHIIGVQDGISYQSFLPREFSEPSSSFTDFENITSDQVLEWLKAELGEEMLTTLKEGLAAIPGSTWEKDSKVARANPVEKDLLG